MAYPLRHIDAHRPYFVTARTTQGRFLLRPSPLVNELVGAILARAVRLYGVQLFDFVFTSNHFHMIVAAPSPRQFAGFMQFLMSNIAVKVGRFFNWRNGFWDRRYSCEPILDDAAFLERVRYIKAHGVKEKLVARIEDWPGLTSLPELLEGVVRSFPWRSWTKLWNELKRGVRNSLGRVERYSMESVDEMEVLVLTPYPWWSQMSDEQRRKEAQLIVQEVNAQFAWTSDKSKSLVRKVLEQSAFSKPKTSKHSTRPKCHASSKEQWLSWVHQHRAVVAAYRDASKRWLQCAWDAVFPVGCFLPPGWRCVREIVSREIV